MSANTNYTKSGFLTVIRSVLTVAALFLGHLKLCKPPLGVILVQCPPCHEITQFTNLDAKKLL